MSEKRKSPRVGDIVKLASGGPLMSIYQLEPAPPSFQEGVARGTLAHCCWFRDREYHHAVFDPRTLYLADQLKPPTDLERYAEEEE